MKNLCFKQSGWLTLLLIAASITEGRTIDVSVSIVPDSVHYGNNRVELTCSYPGLGGPNLIGVNWTAVGNDMFHYFPDGSSYPQGAYVGRVKQKNVNEASNTIEMTGTSWCADLGEYRCDVESSVGSDHGNATIIAVKPEIMGFLCNDEPCSDEETYPLDDMKVECSFLYYQALEVMLNGTYGSHDSGGNLTGQDSCTYRTWATLKFTPEGRDLTITCTAKHGEPQKLMLKFKADIGLSGGEIAGIVIGCIAGVAIVAGVIFFLRSVLGYQ